MDHPRWASHFVGLRGRSFWSGGEQGVAGGFDGGYVRVVVELEVVCCWGWA